MIKPSVSDFKSGFLVFLIALPLCLGIAMASSFPPIAGVFTAIVGGVMASFIGSSPLTIKGPAAGLIVIILAAVTELGQGDLILGYKRCLAVCVIVALLQIIASRTTLTRFVNLVPPSAIHGMLAAIGIIIIAKQIHVLMGVLPHGKTPFQLIFEIPQTLREANPEIVFAGLMTLSVIIFLPMFKHPMFKKVPPALIALIMVIPLGLFWHFNVSHTYTLFHHTYSVGPKFLVTLPTSVFHSVTFPDFTILATPLAWKHVVMIFAIASLESLLTVSAVDSLTGKKSRLPSDLFATGIGNLISALIGGLPMISEVVRSKANIDNGAKSQWSNFFHGVFLLVAITMIGDIIHDIPLAALAAMLIITGFRLSSPHEFYKTYLIGSDQLIIFSVTVFMSLYVDILVGVTSGIALKILLHMIRGVKPQEFLFLPMREVEEGDTIIIRPEGSVVFCNYLRLENQLLRAIEKKKKVRLELDFVHLVDHTCMVRLTQLVLEQEGKMEMTGLYAHRPASQHELATRRVA